MIAKFLFSFNITTNINNINYEFLKDNNSIQITKKNEDKLLNFIMENNYEYDKQNPICSNEKCNKYTISWNHKNMGNIIFTLRIYENPQIDNGISIDIQNNAQKCIGLLINNYKPHLMKLENIKQNKNKKLRRKLKRTKNKFSIKKLTGKNEYWYNVKK